MGSEPKGDPEQLGVHPIILEILAYAKELQAGPARLVEPWFRGQADKAWPLEPAVERRSFLDHAVRLLADLPPVEATGSSALGLERMINPLFRRLATQFLQRPDDLTAVYMEAQHHGMPTRLLDWTTNPLVALYFACESALNADARVWTVSPVDTYYYQVWDSERGAITTLMTITPVGTDNEAFTGQIPNLFQEHRNPGVRPVEGPDDRLRKLEAQRPDLFQFEQSNLGGVLPVLPGLSFSRLAGQQGCFTFHPLGSKLRKDVGYFDIPAASKREIVDDLARLGVSPATIFPGLEGVARTVIQLAGL